MSTPDSPHSTPPTAENPGPNAHLGLIFSALILTMVMASLGQTVLATALPTIVGESEPPWAQRWWARSSPPVSGSC